MVYVFVFLGEFGYELMNWHGVVRKFAATIGSEDRIVCCSRANLYPLYEMADEFVDISAVPLFRQSRASGYSAIFTAAAVDRRQIRSYGLLNWLRLRLRTYLLVAWLPVQLQRYIIAHSKILRDRDLAWWLRAGISKSNPRCIFIFSTPTTRLHGCTFGYETVENDIYDNLNIANNSYRKIEPDLSMRQEFEAQLGWSLEEPFVLVQGRKRDASTRQPSTDTLAGMVAEEALISTLGGRIKTVLLSFDTGRWLDSYSTFTNQTNTYAYRCRTFPEQACLIHFAQQCLFLTEGDFGSHIYVPPFLGKDVIALAPRSVYALGTTPVDFWNKHVFQFGGQVVPKVAEEVLASTETINTLLDEILAQHQLASTTRANLAP